MHYKEVCRVCKVVISQCRCPGQKEIREGLCKACASGARPIGLTSDNALRNTVEALDFLVAAEPWLREIEMQALRAHDPAFSAAVLELGKVVRSARVSASAAVGASG